MVPLNVLLVPVTWIVPSLAVAAVIAPEIVTVSVSAKIILVTALFVPSSKVIVVVSKSPLTVTVLSSASASPRHRYLN